MSVLGIDDFLMSLSGLTDALHENTHYNLIAVNVSNLTSAIHTHVSLLTSTSSHVWHSSSASSDWW